MAMLLLQGGNAIQHTIPASLPQKDLSLLWALCPPRKDTRAYLQKVHLPRMRAPLTPGGADSTPDEM